jgi:rare lipoprotein A
MRQPQIAAKAIPALRTPPLTRKVAAAASWPAARIYVQAGAFSMRDNARRAQSRIAHLGSVQVTAASVNGVEMYRVRIGPLRSAKQADQLLARVVDSGYPKARIVGD